MKKILLIISLILCLTGCVSATVPEDNSCYRYIDYKGEEHFTDYHSNYCSMSNGNYFCKDGEKRIKVLEFEIVECPKEE